MDRRVFAHRFSALCFGGFWGTRNLRASDLILTPKQTRGPFYPIPEIANQTFFDVDLTRKSDSGPTADGEVIAIRGKVLDLSGKPLDRVIVEIWQACSSGRYNHPNDKGESPLDPNFQYWGKMETGTEGHFSFKTIVPGKYPGRTPHIHFRVVAPQRELLETQLYFEANDALNKKDGVYKSILPEQRKAVTTGFEQIPVDLQNPEGLKLPTGTFEIVLGPKNDSKSTPGM
jgi:protocatechuate 3,4-dioxygenase beta subunit